MSSRILQEQFRHYWESGTTFVDASEATAAICPNATFFFCKAGEGFNVHYGTDPMAPFHLAPVFGNAKRDPTVGDLVTAARSQFREWCAAFRAAAVAGRNPPVVRFLLGEAIAVARTLQGIDGGPNTNLKSEGVYLSPWSARPLELEKGEYIDRRAPTRFDIIDTSNLCDNVGFLNIFLAAVPLLSSLSPTPVLYTETLLLHNFGYEATHQLQSTLFADLSALALLLNLVPVDALSGFATRSNTHELTLLSMRTSAASSVQQYHQTLTWKRPQILDPQSGSRPTSNIRLTVVVSQLADLLHSVYCHLFAHEDDILRQAPAGGPTIRPSSHMGTQEAYVAFLHFVHCRLQLPLDEWSTTMSTLMDRLQTTAARHRLSALSLSLAELQAQAFRYRVFEPPGMNLGKHPPVGRLSLWQTIPPLVRIFLAVPRSRMALLGNVKVPIPRLHCIIRSPEDSVGEHIFQSVDAAFGSVVDSGTSAEPRITLQEDDLTGGPDTAESTIVVSFVVPSNILAGTSDPASIVVALGVHLTRESGLALLPVLGPALIVFSTNLEDRNSVHIVAENPIAQASLPSEPPVAVLGEIGKYTHVHVDINAERRSVVALSTRVDVEDTRAKSALTNRAAPTFTHVSPCVMQVRLGQRTQHIVFPLPVAGAHPKVRLARKSSFIEVC